MTSKTHKPRERRAKRKVPEATSQFAPGHRPHNAKTAPPVTSVAELVRRIANEPRQVIINGYEVSMSLAERRLRTEIDAALKAQARPLKHLIQLMIKYPNLVRSKRRKIQIIVDAALADV